MCVAVCNYIALYHNFVSFVSDYSSCPAKGIKVTAEVLENSPPPPKKCNLLSLPLFNKKIA
jgi:hypothetical protein